MSLGHRRSLAVLACCLALGREARAEIRDLATSPAEATWTGTSPPADAIDLDNDGILDLATTSGVLRVGPLRLGGRLLAAGTPLLATGGARPAVADLDGDGRDDLALGTPALEEYLDWIYHAIGGAGVLFTPHATPDVALLYDGLLPGFTPRVDWFAWGSRTDTFLGDRIATGDVNGDGVEDLVVGSLSGVYWGTTRVLGFFGPLRPGTLLRLDDTDADFTIESVASYATGIAVGDMDGDGHADVAVGGVDVYSGSRLIGTVDGGTPDLRVSFSWPQPFPWCSDRRWSIPIRIADLDGDGLGDLVLGLPSMDVVHVVRGRAPLPATVDVSAGGADLTILSGTCGSDLGASIGTGDWTGDGIDDLAMGAPRWGGPDGTRTDAGAVHVLAGGPALVGTIDLAIATTALTVHGAEPGDRLGAGDALSGLVLADLDGDGTVDMAMHADGARGLANAYGGGSGETDIVLNAPRGPLAVLHSPDDPRALTMVAPNATAPWDAAPGLLDDGRLHFFQVDAGAGSSTTIFVTPQLAQRTVRLSWSDGPGSAVPVSRARSSVEWLDACVHADATSAARLRVTPRDGRGDRLGACLDVRPAPAAAWMPAVPSGGFRDLGDGSYELEVASVTPATIAADVVVEGVSLATASTTSFRPDGPSIERIPGVYLDAAGEPATFTAVVTGVAPIAVTWDVGADGTIDGTGAAFTWTPPSPGWFPVAVAAEDGAGCRSRRYTAILLDPR